MLMMMIPQEADAQKLRNVNRDVLHERDELRTTGEELEYNEACGVGNIKELNTQVQTLTDQLGDAGAVINSLNMRICELENELAFKEDVVQESGSTIFDLQQDMRAYKLKMDIKVGELKASERTLKSQLSGANAIIRNSNTLAREKSRRDERVSRLPPTTIAICYS